MIIKEVKPFGNGAQILVPKELIGKKVVLYLQDRSINDIREEILSNINSLSNVVCIVLIGSYARNEQIPTSDIDVVIFCTEKLELSLTGYHIILINVNKLKEEIMFNPALFKSILEEGIIILNLDFLKNIKITNRDIKNYKKTCYEVYLMNRELINLDKKQNTISSSVVYSIILRLRALFILKNKYLFKEFRTWLIKNGITKFDNLYKIYKSIRDDKGIKEIDYNLINEIEKANEFLLKQLK